MRIEYSIRVNDDNYIKGELTGTACEIHAALKEPLNIMQVKENQLATEKEIWHPMRRHVYEAVVLQRGEVCNICALTKDEGLH